jgi:iron complex transport system substrate-binding protein
MIAGTPASLTLESSALSHNSTVLADPSAARRPGTDKASEPRRGKGPALLWPGILIASALALAAGAAIGQPSGETPRRVASLSVCGDQLLLAMAAPAQIASLSSDSTDRRVSYYADIADRYPHGAGGIEALIGYAPDLVLVDAGVASAARQRMERLGYRVFEIEPVRTIDQSITQVLEVAVLLGREEQGAALATVIDSARRQATRTNWGDTAVSFRRGGSVPGNDTLMTDLLAVIGLNNVGELLSAGTGRVPLETLVAAPPDYLVVPEPDSAAAGQGMAMLTHPALMALFPPARRILLPDRLTYCGGPSLPEALRWLASEFERVTP